MSEGNKIGNNIKILRNVFGETQEDLANAVDLSKNAISNYETGKRQPSSEIMALLAKHFGISVEELTNSDMPFLSDCKFHIDRTAYYKNIDIVLPIISSEAAINNVHFRKAYDFHKSLYEDLHDLNTGAKDEDMIDEVDICINEYWKAYEDDFAKVETSANLISLMIFSYSVLNTFELLKQPNAMVFNLISRDPKTKKVIDNIDSYSIAEIECIKLKKLPKILNAFGKLFLVLKHSESHSDLADYYIAQKYINGIIANNLDNEINSRIGAEMINSFASVENMYAKRYIRFIADDYLNVFQKPS